MCNRDCLNCTYDDCIDDAITQEERKEQDDYDRTSIRERIKEERSGLRKGKLKYYDYNHSEKGKERLQRYEQSEKGKARRKRNQAKVIASGKNAEYCRAYYQRKKLERAECK